MDDEQLKGLRALYILRGQEIAKLGRRVYHQRLIIREIQGYVRSSLQETKILAEDVARENRILKDQNRKLIIANREMRLLLVSYKPEL